MDKQEMPEMAHTFDAKVKLMDYEIRSSTLTMTFQDSSRIKIQLTSKPDPRVVGGPDSEAAQIWASVKTYNVSLGKMELIFTDGSKVSYSSIGQSFHSPDRRN